MSAPLLSVLTRIAEALERLSPAPGDPPLPDGASAHIWEGRAMSFVAVPEVARVPLDLLVGVDRQKATLLANTARFAQGLPANNALLWGARGMGKSSLVKAVHAELRREHTDLCLVEVHREEIATLPDLMRLLRRSPCRWLIFCDDLSFDAGDASYKALKAALDGGLEGRPANCLFYATSNRRHLLPRDIMENESRDAINPRDVVEEKISLSDRFGLWIGFHSCSQDEYLAMIDGYAGAFGLTRDREALHAAALEWSVTRGARSGRVAWQCIQQFAGAAGAARTKA